MWVLFPWVLGIGVVFAGFLAWFQNMGNTFDIVSLYQVFPILGIWAWSLMWTHFVIWEIRRLKPTLPGNALYSKVSGIVVFIFLLLHPGILAIEQFRQGKGLPPSSYFAYAGETSVWLIMLSMVGLTGFLFYEVIIRFEKKERIKKIWWFVNITQSVAMISIFTHGLELGGDLHGGWFRTYWIWLGLLLIPCILHTHWSDIKSHLKK